MNGKLRAIGNLFIDKKIEETKGIIKINFNEKMKSFLVTAVSPHFPDIGFILNAYNWKTL